jgi:hypothetical protein
VIEQEYRESAGDAADYSELIARSVQASETRYYETKDREATGGPWTN